MLGKQREILERSRADAERGHVVAGVFPDDGLSFEEQIPAAGRGRDGSRKFEQAWSCPHPFGPMSPTMWPGAMSKGDVVEGGRIPPKPHRDVSNGQDVGTPNGRPSRFSVLYRGGCLFCQS